MTVLERTLHAGIDRSQVEGLIKFDDRPLCADFVAKVFLGGERKLSAPLMRFARGAARDHIVSSKIDHGRP